jgi:two-component system, cell cycle response regulator DivK
MAGRGRASVNPSARHLSDRITGKSDMATKPKILVVDDLPSNLKLMRVLLSSEGYLVSTAVDGEDALLAVMDDPPDLIISDLHMPGMGGVALIRGLKINESTRRIPILAVTSTDTTDEETRLAKASGCDATYMKPINTRTLKNIISKLLKQ